MSDEPPHLIHNLLAVRLAAQIVRQVPDFIEQLIVIESVIVAVIGLQRLLPGGDNEALDILHEGAISRLSEHREKSATVLRLVEKLPE